MSETVGMPIQLESVGKCYRIYRNPQDRFRQAILDRFRRGGLQAAHAPLYREHWAVRGVSLELAAGEAVGILGRNGAGKSTLLQLIAGTLEPTEGEVRTEGRITALLELGSGFNPEFTGRENVFLNGQILGLDKREIDARFDEIAAFADIGDFLEQPVKTYSSGMMMRLAFAVQTALTPNVLIVDEALAVGDVFFQAKCMRRLRAMRDEGTTILFVSHSIGTVKEICTRALLLDHGRLIDEGKPSRVAHEYVRLISDEQRARESVVAPDFGGTNADPGAGDDLRAITMRGTQEDFLDGMDAFQAVAAHERLGNQKAEFLNVVLRDSAGQITNSFSYGESVRCRMVIRINDEVSNLWVGYKIKTISGIDIIHADSSLFGQLAFPYVKGACYVVDWDFDMKLVHGNYVLGCAMAIPDPPEGIERVMEYVDVVGMAGTFTVSPRKKGMIGPTAVWDNNLEITRIDPGCHSLQKTGACK